MTTNILNLLTEAGAAAQMQLKHEHCYDLIQRLADALATAHAEGRRSALQEIAADVDRFIRMEISAGKLAELYGWDKHGFKTATHAFCDCSCGLAQTGGEDGSTDRGRARVRGPAGDGGPVWAPGDVARSTDTSEVQRVTEARRAALRAELETGGED